jgi:transaldolase/glucose-6-phosphate isomerase
VAYRRFLDVFGSERFKKLQAKGAKVQRPLWASTGTKNEAYSDILYVQELIGPDTVNTMPPQTIDAFRDHGVVRRTIDEGYADAERALRELAEAGISIDQITDELQADGVKLFSESFKKIGETITRKARELQVSAA